MKENSELLAQQIKSAGIQVSSSRPTIELVTPGTGKNGETSAVCPPNCIPNCPPVCPPEIRIPPPFPCPPFGGLPRPPSPFPPRPN